MKPALETKRREALDAYVSTNAPTKIGQHRHTTNNLPTGKLVQHSDRYVVNGVTNTLTVYHFTDTNGVTWRKAVATDQTRGKDWE